jgi:two-component system LytT family sensor kinase
LHVVTISLGPYFAGDLIGFTTGLLITVLLLVLTLRAAKVPGTPVANIIFAVCALLWTAGGLIHAALTASGMPGDGRLILSAQAIQFTGAAAFPIPVLAIWQPFATGAWQRTAARLVRIAAYLFAATVAALVWSRPFLGAWWLPFVSLHSYTAYTATLLVIAGAATSLRRDTTPRSLYLPSLAIVSAVGAATISMTIAQHLRMSAARAVLLTGVASHLVLLVVLCAFLLFARFRLADVFIRYGVRILLAGIWAALLAFTAQSAFLRHVSMNARAPGSLHVFLVIIVANGLLLSFTFVDERISSLLNRWLFRSQDYGTARRQLATRLRDLSLPSEVVAAVEEAARVPLELGARLIALDSLELSAWPSGILEGELVELDYTDPIRSRLPLPNAEVLIPVTSTGRVSHVLLVSPGPARPGLVTHDLEYLRAIAVQCGNRLDALHRQEEAIERESREALLLQQVTEAELSALRAQINPHFLFNSLNTVADLIVRDPPRAEAMTLRLASVFRHVLAHAARPLTSIRDEIEFLRTYLYIEEARFGSRLQVEIDVMSAVANEHLPSLILQPLVENALKHGLGPKPGPGHLWISAQPQGEQVRLRVEDDGIGPAWSSLQPNGRAPATSGHRSGSPGLGLANVAARLKTLYHDRASVVLEPREGGGSRVTVLIPRGDGVKP